MMLANPIVIPAYANPIVWSLALISMLVEIHTALFLIRRMKRNVQGLGGPLFVVNMMTWIPFLVAIDSLPQQSVPLWMVVVAAMEALIVLVEGLLIFEVTRGRFFSRNLPCRPIRLRQAMYVSLLANLASIACSVGIPVVIWPFVR